MTISRVSETMASRLDVDQGLVHEPSQADANFFSTALQTAALAAPTPLPALLAGSLVDRLQSTDKLSEQAMRKMKTASVSGDPMDLSQMTKALSDYSLQTAISTKVINKMGQTLDKLTNLQ